MEAEKVNPVATPPKKTMFNYFSKLPSKTKIVEDNPRKSAPEHNKQHVEQFQSKVDQFDAELLSDYIPIGNYLKSLLSGQLKPFRFKIKTRGRLRARLLQFSEDVRPPYFGTWQKKSKLVNGRRPFGKDDEIFDYDVDSEAEWDIGGPGESLKGDDSEDEDDGQDDYEIDMKTFVPHGYVSDDENENDSDSEIRVTYETNKNNQQVVTPKQVPKTELKPIILGVSYDDNPTISEAKIEFLKAFQGISCN